MFLCIQSSLLFCDLSFGLINECLNSCRLFQGLSILRFLGSLLIRCTVFPKQQKIVFYSCSLVKLRKFLIYQIKDFTGKKIGYVSIPLTPSPPVGHVPPPLPPPPPSVMPCPGESQISSVAFCFLLFLDNTFQSNHLDASKTLLGELSQEWTVVTR